MSKIIKVLRPIKYGPNDKWARATVRLDDGTEGSVFIGGEVHPPILHNGVIKVYIKRNKNVDKVQGNKVQ